MLATKEFKNDNTDLCGKDADRWDIIHISKISNSNIAESSLVKFVHICKRYR